jgi:hypothetical protein
MSHELRTPLNAILGFAQLMETGLPAPTVPQKRNLDRILKAGWYLLELINEILDLALIESGKVILSHEPVSLAEVMLECRNMVEPQATTRGITMSFPVFTQPCFVGADRTRIKQVLINLLFNAIKYNRPGGTVDVRFTLGPDQAVRISVGDTGNGLEPAQLAQLFQPFNRLGKEAGVEEGTGIGLVVSKRLIELMEGMIGVESTVGVGSVFWIELMAAEAPLLTDGAGRDAVEELPDPFQLPWKLAIIRLDREPELANKNDAQIVYFQAVILVGVFRREDHFHDALARDLATRIGEQLLEHHSDHGFTGGIGQPHEERLDNDLL